MNPIDFIPILLVFGVMYWLVIRPQIREKQEHDKLVQSLSRGDRVVTASGVHGVISNVADDTVHLEIAEKVKIVVDKTTIARRLTGETQKAG